MILSKAISTYASSEDFARRDQAEAGLITMTCNQWVSSVDWQ